MDIIDELLSIAGALHHANLEYALCGGLALGLHGLPRATQDIDILVHEKDVDAIRSAVAPLGYILPSQRMTFGAGTPKERRLYRVSKAEGEELLTLDLLVAEPGLIQVLKTRTVIPLKGVPLKTVSRDGLIRMKEWAGRPKDILDLDSLRGVSHDE